jgi:hypothetical protein
LAQAEATAMSSGVCGAVSLLVCVRGGRW